jgi:uncharacterized membrane protein YphA (DoxX/SURF4 family)
MTRRAQVVTWTARVLLAGLLIAAGWPKAHDPAAFIRDLWNYRLFPETWAYWIAAWFPYLEIAVGVALVTGMQRRGAHLLTAAMLAVFLLVHVSAWMRGMDIACGCFGSTPGDGAAWHPAWWIALILGMAAALAVSMRAESAQRASGAARA